ncbi:MAG: hypothetical protein ACRD0P_29650 [Stackebrandtia sp.]
MTTRLTAPRRTAAAGFRENFHGATIRVDSPDGNIAARFETDGSLRFAFARDTYDRYDEDTLSRQLPRLLGDAFRERDRVRQEALNATTGEVVEVWRDWELDTRQREYRRLREEIHCRGKSGDGLVKFRRTGSEDWQARITAGALRRLSEPGFRTALSTAVSAALRDYRIQLARARVTVYGDADLREIAAFGRSR